MTSTHFHPHPVSHDGPRRHPAPDDATLSGGHRTALVYLDAWNAHDVDAICNCFTENASYDDWGADEHPAGQPALREYVAGILRGFPDIQFQVEKLAYGPGFTIAEWRCTMTQLGDYSGLYPSGRRLRSAGTDVATLDSRGRIAHMSSYYDGATIMRGLKLLPARRSLTERLLISMASWANRWFGPTR
jgi:steroid delta-isomerase-like uncharacterized protein